MLSGAKGNGALRLVGSVFGTWRELWGAGLSDVVWPLHSLVDQHFQSSLLSVRFLLDSANTKKKSNTVPDTRLRLLRQQPAFES